MLKKAAQGIIISAVYGIFVLLLEYSLILGIVNENISLKQILAASIVYIILFALTANIAYLFIRFYRKMRNQVEEIPVTFLVILTIILISHLSFELSAGHFFDHTLKFYMFLWGLTGIGSLFIYWLTMMLLKRGEGLNSSIALIRTAGLTAGISVLTVFVAKTTLSSYMKFITGRIGLLWYVNGLLLALGFFILARQLTRLFIGKREKIKLPPKSVYLTTLSLLIIAGAYLTAGFLWRGQINRKVDAQYVSSGESPNVIFIVIDALRADRVDLYGSQRRLTPNIDKYSSQGTVFRNALANSSWTSPSAASYFTSRYPGMNTVQEIDNRLPEELVTLTEQMQEAGYYTRAVSENMIVSPSNNYDQGFSDFIVNAGHRNKNLLFPPILLVLTYPYIVELGHQWGLIDDGDGMSANSAAIDFIKKNTDKRYFLYLHYMGPHLPYMPLEPRFSAGERLHPVDLIVMRFIRTPEAGSLLRPSALKIIKDRYDDEVFESDKRIGELFGALDEIGGWDNTMVILTSDHGEEFLEHGMGDHGNSMYRELLEVPLILWLPSVDKIEKTVDQKVELIDIAPTVLDYCGIEPAAKQEGSSLVPLIKGDYLEFSGNERDYYGEVRPLRKTSRGDWIYAYMQGNFKLIKNEFDNESKPPVYLLYNLQEDPAESEDVSHLYPEVFQRMQVSLDSLYDYCRENAVIADKSDNVKLSGEQLKQLNTLGYSK